MTIDKKYYLEGTEKVGDKVWSLHKWLVSGNGDCNIISINCEDTLGDMFFLVKTDDSASFTVNGIFSEVHKLPSLFKSNPFISEFPKMMEVSVGDSKWFKETVYTTKGSNINMPIITNNGYYKFAREIQIKPKLSEFLKEKFYKAKSINLTEKDMDDYSVYIERDFKTFLAGFKQKGIDINQFENDL